MFPSDQRHRHTLQGLRSFGLITIGFAGLALNLIQSFSSSITNDLGFSSLISISVALNLISWKTPLSFLMQFIIFWLRSTIFTTNGLHLSNSFASIVLHADGILVSNAHSTHISSSQRSSSMSFPTTPISLWATKLRSCF